MTEIGTYEAKAHLAEILDRVERGERILITRNGRPAAIIGPVPGARRRTVDEAVEELLEFRQTHKLGMSFREAIEEGRRY